MKRGVFDTLRRSLDDTFANWGLIVVRVVEAVVFVMLTLLTALAVLIPILVSVGIQIADISTPDDIENAVLSLAGQWILLLWAFVAIVVLLLLFVALHSFVEAGCARVYVDGERKAGPALEGPRARYHAFSVQRWLAGARDGWWTVFWIYNLAWGVAGLILLIPLLPTAVLMFVFRETPPALITSGCIGLVLTALLGLAGMVVTSLWTNRAVADWAVLDLGASASLSSAWRALKTDLGRHVLIALAIFVVAMAGSSFFASFSFMAAFGEAMHRSGLAAVSTIPIRFAASILSSLFSACVTSWYLAAFTTLAVEEPRHEG